MKYIYLIFLAFLSLNGSAQKIRFTDHTNAWQTIASSADCENITYYYGYTSDTIFNGKTYSELEGGSFPPYNCDMSVIPPFIQPIYVREDTVSHIVYYLDQFLDTPEYTLYNYNLNLGDTILYHQLGRTITDSVVGVDSTIINGVFHKIIILQNKLTATSAARSYAVIEGVGSTNNPLWPYFFEGCFEWYEYLACFTQSGNGPQITGPAYLCGYTGYDTSFKNCSPLATKNIYRQSQNITITPNPATDHIQVAIDGQFEDNTFISIYDMGGRCIYRVQAEQLTNNATISTSLWKDGLYMVVVQNNAGVIKKEKVIVMQ